MGMRRSSSLSARFLGGGGGAGGVAGGSGGGAPGSAAALGARRSCSSCGNEKESSDREKAAVAKNIERAGESTEKKDAPRPSACAAARPRRKQGRASARSSSLLDAAFVAPSWCPSAVSQHKDIWSSGAVRRHAVRRLLPRARAATRPPHGSRAKRRRRQETQEAGEGGWS